MELTELRKEMDDLDRQLISVFQKRMELSRQIAERKQQQGKPVYDQRREQEKMTAVSELLPKPLKRHAKPLYSCLMGLSRDYQNRMLNPSATLPFFQEGNIILIGMPGCGKTSLALSLGQALRRPVWDSDTEMEARFGLSAGELLRQKGEPAFRKLENAILRELCANTGCIVSTGGGCITLRENCELLHNSGTVIWLRRELSELATSERPLSEAFGVDKLWAQREPLYRDLCDITIENQGSIPAVTTEICRILGYMPQN